MAVSIVKRAANVIASSLLSDSQQKPIVAFGIEAAIYKALHFGVAVLIGAMFGKVIDIILFHLFYQKLRTYAGGHHAKSNIVCFICSCGIAVGTLTFWSFCPVAYKTLCTIVFLLVSVPIIWLLAPVEATNKPLDEAETNVYRKKARMFLLIEAITIVTLYFVGVINIALVGATALLTLSVMLVLGKFKNVFNLFQRPRDIVE